MTDKLTDLSRTERLLTTCLHIDQRRPHEAELADLPSADWDELEQLIGVQRVRPLVLARLRDGGRHSAVPSAMLERLTTSCRAIARRNLQRHFELVRIIDALETHRIPVILLKGAHVASTLYGDVGLREIGDLDLLVRRDHLARAVETAIELGYRSSKPVDVELDATLSHHAATLIGPASVALDLHWTLTNPRAPYAIDPDELWSRAGTIPLAKCRVLTLSHEDLLQHLCAHAAYQHRFEFGLRSLCDIAKLLAKHGETMDWALVEQQLPRRRWVEGTVLMLKLARALLGAPLPPRAMALVDQVSVSDIVVNAAQTQLLSRHPSVVPRGMSTLHDHDSAATRFRHFGNAVFVSRDVLRRMYPEARGAWWRWCLAYCLRARDVLRRHAGLALRLWFVRQPSLRALLRRQQVIRAYLRLTSSP